MNELKSLWKSWTIWFNGIAVTLLAGLEAVKEFVPNLEQFLEPSYYKNTMVGILLANFILRFKTQKQAATVVTNALNTPVPEAAPTPPPSPAP